MTDPWREIRLTGTCMRHNEQYLPLVPSQTTRVRFAHLARLPGETLDAFYERQEHVNAGLGDV